MARKRGLVRYSRSDPEVPEAEPQNPSLLPLAPKDRHVRQFDGNPYVSWSMMKVAQHFKVCIHTVRNWITRGAITAEFDAESRRWWIPEYETHRRPVTRGRARRMRTYRRLSLVQEFDREYVSIQRAARFLACDAGTVVRLVANCDLPAIRIPGTKRRRAIIRIARSALHEFVKTKLNFDPTSVENIYSGPRVNPRIAAVVTCQNCRYWSQVDFPHLGWGVCALLSNPQSAPPNDNPPTTQHPLASTFDHRGYPAALYTHPSFACRQGDLIPLPKWDSPVTSPRKSNHKVDSNG